jgi:hypothetical protein
MVAPTVQSGALWKRMLRYQAEGFLMGCAFSASSKAAVEKDRGQGILAGHAYSVLDVRDTRAGIKLLRIRNPWGQGEWKGRWADYSKEWTRDIKKELNYEFSDDGTFWIQWEDFIRQYSKLYVVRLYEDSFVPAGTEPWDKKAASGSWSGSSAGGCMNNPTWPENPQYGFRLLGAPGKRSRVFIHLSQDDVRPQGGKGFTKALGFYVLRAKELTAKITSITDESSIVYRGSFNFDREVSLELSLECGVPGGYVIIPCIFDSGVEGNFRLVVFGESPLEFSELRSGPQVVIESAWKFDNAGGSPNHPEWRKNLQWGLSVLEPCPVTITLSQPPVRAPKTQNAIGFQVHQSSNGLFVSKGKEPIVAEGPYIEGPSTTSVVMVPANGCVVIIPSTFLPSKLGQFSLRISAPSPFVVGPLNRSTSAAWPGVSMAQRAREAGVMNDVNDAKWIISGGTLAAVKNAGMNSTVEAPKQSAPGERYAQGTREKIFIFSPLFFYFYFYFIFFP